MPNLDEVLTYYGEDEMKKLVVELRVVGESHPQIEWVDYIVEYLETGCTDVTDESVKKMGRYKLNNASPEALNSLIDKQIVKCRDPDYWTTFSRVEDEWRIRTMAVELFGPKIVEFLELRGVLSIGVQQ